MAPQGVVRGEQACHVVGELGEPGHREPLLWRLESPCVPVVLAERHLVGLHRDAGKLADVARYRVDRQVGVQAPELVLVKPVDELGQRVRVPERRLFAEGAAKVLLERDAPHLADPGAAGLLPGDALGLQLAGQLPWWYGQAHPPGVPVVAVVVPHHHVRDHLGVLSLSSFDAMPAVTVSALPEAPSPRSRGR